MKYHIIYLVTDVRSNSLDSQYIAVQYNITSHVAWQKRSQIWNKQKIISRPHREARWCLFCYGPLTRYTKLRLAHAPGMPGTVSPPPSVSDPDKHHGMCKTHVSWCMLGSLTSGFLWSRWWEKRSRRMRNLQFTTGIRLMKQFKQFAHNWHLPWYQWTKACYHVSFKQNNIW